MANQPPEKPTVNDMERVPPWAIALTEKVQTGIATLRADISLVANDLDVLKGRVGNLETARATDEARANANSIKVRAVSDNDLTQDAKMADLIVWRNTVDNSLDDLKASIAAITKTVTSIHSAVTGVIDNPKVRAVGKVVFTIVMTYAAARGFVKGLP